jgi:hypothetical protein
MNIKTLLLAAILTHSAAIYAGDRRGNGGDGLLINGSPVVLDLVEAGVDDKPFFDSSVKINPLLLGLIKKNLPKFPEVHNRLALKLTEIERISSPFAWAIAESYRFFNLKIVNAALVDVKDEDSVVDYDQSKLVQLAIRRANNILINGSWWPKLSIDQKVALLVHESIYSFQKTENVKTLIGITPDGKAAYETKKGQISVPARAITGFLFTEELKTASKMDLVQLTHDKNNLQYLVETKYEFNEQINFVKREINPYINQTELRSAVLYYFDPLHFSIEEKIESDSSSKKVTRLCKNFSGLYEMSGVGIMMNPNPDLGLLVSGPIITSLFDAIETTETSNDHLTYQSRCEQYIDSKISELQ